jgi:hypothetical protein
MTFKIPNVPSFESQKLEESTCSRGFAHLVLATEIHPSDHIAIIDELWSFCFSLIQAVLMLHEEPRICIVTSSQTTSDGTGKVSGCITLDTHNKLPVRDGCRVLKDIRHLNS